MQHKFLIHVSIISIIALFVNAMFIPCYADSKKEKTADTCYYIITAKPDNAVITLNGSVRDTLRVVCGTIVKWSVALEGYKTKQGIDTINVAENCIHDVSLEYVKKAQEQQTDPKMLLTLLICIAVFLVLLLGCLLVYLVQKRKGINRSMESSTL